jgi:hypothetical protein
MTMSRLYGGGLVRPLALAISAIVTACGSSVPDVSNALTPTGPTPPNLASVVSQNGCAMTVACTNIGVDGLPATSPTFERITLETGTAPACRAPLYRITPSPTLPVEFAVRAPSRDYGWRVRPFDTSLMAMSPSFGNADSRTPVRASAYFRPSALGPLSPGMNFTQNLVLEIYRAVPSVTAFNAPAVATCSVIVWGSVSPTY